MYAQSALALSLSGSRDTQRGGNIVRLPQLVKMKGAFMSKTLILFVSQLIVTYVVFHTLGKSDVFYSWVENNRILYIALSVIIPIGLILILAFLPMPMYAKLILFTVFSIVIGFSLAYIQKFVSEDVINASLIGAVMIFVAMFMVGLFLVVIGVNVWWLGILLFAALLGIIVTSIVFLFINPSKKAQRIKAAIALVIFGLFVLYDTNQILQREYPNDDFVTAAMDYYLDIINIFVNLIQYFVSSN